MPRRRKYLYSQPYGGGYYEFFEVIRETEKTYRFRQVQTNVRMINRHKYSVSPSTKYEITDPEDDTSYVEFRVSKDALEKNGKYTLWDGKALQSTSRLSLGKADVVNKFRKLSRSL